MLLVGEATSPGNGLEDSLALKVIFSFKRKRGKLAPDGQTRGGPLPIFRWRSTHGGCNLIVGRLSVTGQSAAYLPNSRPWP